MPTDNQPTGEAATDEAQPSLLERIEQFERWTGPTRSADDPGTTGTKGIPDVQPILPDGWRSTRPPKKRRRRRKQTRQLETAAPPPKRRRRRARWFVLLLLIAGGAAAAYYISEWLPTVGEERAAELRDEYRLGLGELEATLPDLGPVIATVSAGEATSEDIETVLVPFGRFQSAATGLAESARAPLPTTPPLVPRDAIEELAPIRERVSLVAGRADAIAGRVAKFVRYRTELDNTFTLPQLPRRTEGEAINDLSLSLAQSLADTTNALTALPGDPLLDAHRALVSETLDFMREWEIDYLDALRRDDFTLAGARINSLQRRLDELDAALAPGLDEFRAWALAELSGLERDVAGAQIVVGP